MTAVAGLWRYSGDRDAGEGGADREIARMGAALAAYGPDAAGHSTIGGIGLSLACRQSHITETDRLDGQPLWDREGRLCVVADARIDNGAELAAAFGWPRRDGENVSDAALILAAYRHWGTGCVDRLTGDFAFALWDGAQQHLLLARDHYGSRPLFFAHQPGLFAFASMPGGLFALEEFSPALEAREVGAFLALLPQVGTTTLYRDLSRVPPGHFLVVRGGQHRLVEYWPGRLQDAAGSRKPQRDYRDHVEEARRLYVAAVNARLRVRPGGGIGSHLSAGFDSSSVTVLAARALSAQGRRLTAFTAAPRPGFAATGPLGRVTDESVVAAEVVRSVRAWGATAVDHCIVHTAPDSPLRALERTLPFLGSPFLNPCNLGWIRAIEREAARRGIKVLLHGAAGNQTISADGFTQFSYLFRRGHWWPLVALARGAVRDGMPWRTVAAGILGPSLPPGLLRRLRRHADDGVFSYTALSPAFVASMDLEGLAAERGRALSFYQTVRDAPSARLRALRQGDPGLYHHASLAQTGVEITDPTADRRLVDFCLQTPEAFFIRQGRQASLFRDAMEGVLPASVLNRRVRGLQAADWYEGLVAARDEIGAELERLEGSALASRALDLERMRRLLAALPDPSTPVDRLPGDWLGRPETVATYRLALLRGLSVGRFIRMVEGGNG